MASGEQELLISTFQTSSTFSYWDLQLETVQEGFYGYGYGPTSNYKIVGTHGTGVCSVSINTGSGPYSGTVSGTIETNLGWEALDDITIDIPSLSETLSGIVSSYNSLDGSIAITVSSHPTSIVNSSITCQFSNPNNPNLDYFNVIGLGGTLLGYGYKDVNSPSNITSFEASYSYGWGYEYGTAIYADNEEKIKIRATVTKDNKPAAGVRIDFFGKPGVVFETIGSEEIGEDSTFNRVIFADTSTTLAGIDPSSISEESLVSAINTIPISRDIEFSIVNLTDTKPVDFVIALDLSGSMETVVPDTGGKTRRQLMIEGAHGLLDNISATNLDVQVAVVEFDNGACVTQSLTTNFVNAKAQISSYSACVNTVPPAPFANTFTNVEYAIHVSHTHLDSNARSEAEKFILLFSDGGEGTGSDGLGEAQSQPYKINTVNFGGGSGATLLQSIANATGGEATSTSDGDELIELLEGQNVTFQVIVQEFTSDRDLVKNSIISLNQDSVPDVNLQAALVRGKEILNNGRNAENKRILLFTSIDENFGDVLTYSENFTIPVDIVYLGNNSNLIEKFNSVSENTGGLFLHTDDVLDLENIFERILSYPVTSDANSFYTNIYGISEIYVKVNPEIDINQIDGWGSFTSSNKEVNQVFRNLTGNGSRDISAKIFESPEYDDGNLTVSSEILQKFYSEVVFNLNVGSYAFNEGEDL